MTDTPRERKKSAVKLTVICVLLTYNSFGGFGGLRKNGKAPGRGSRGKKPLDDINGKRGRGRPRTIPPEWVIGRAENDRIRLTQIWATLSGPLLAAKSEDQVKAAFEEHSQTYATEFVPFTSEILELISDASFPKRAKAQIGFIADSLAGRPTITLRTSRDICSKERAKRRSRSQHKIIRCEFYIECECGYRGPARDDACRKCGAEMPLGMGKHILWP